MFAGWGPSEGPDPSQAQAAEERVDEERGPRDYTPALMIAVPTVLLLGAAVIGLIPEALAAAERAASRFTEHGAYARWVLKGSNVSWPSVKPTQIATVDVIYSLLAVGGPPGAAALGLFGRPLREGAPAILTRPARDVVRVLRGLHSGHVGDYVAWWSAGASFLAGICLVVLK